MRRANGGARTRSLEFPLEDQEGDSEYCEDFEKRNGPRTDLAGFQRAFVGLDVGKFGLPDMDRPNSINGLNHICRECRVSIGEESS